MTETKNSKMLDEGGKSVVALMAALMAAIFAFQLNASMLSPALTTMRVELNTTDAQIGLTQTVFFTSCAVFSLFLPRLGDLIGRKKVLLGILVLTALGCVVSARGQRADADDRSCDSGCCRSDCADDADHAARQGY